MAMMIALENLKTERTDFHGNDGIDLNDGIDSNEISASLLSWGEEFREIGT
jgi:hypothetical protein